MLRLIYAFRLLIFGQNQPDSSSLLPGTRSRAKFLLTETLHTPTRPVDLEFRGHTQIF